MKKIIKIGLCIFAPLFSAGVSAIDVDFTTSDIGVTKKSELWTVGTPNVTASVNHLGNEIDAMRFGAVQEYPLEIDGSLSDEAKAEIDAYVVDRLAKVPGLRAVTLMASSAKSKVDPYYVDENGTDIRADRWVAMFKAYIEYVENIHNLEVLFLEPQNETDFGDKYKRKENWADIHKAFQDDPILTNYPIVGPSTLSAGAAASWWSYVKDHTDWGATHIINGTMTQYVDYLLQVKREGKPYFASENHNLAEMIICAHYKACLGGLWWATSVDKGDWTRVHQISRQIAYVEDRPNWTVATVYKEPNKIWLFASGGTRATSNSAVPTTYTFRASDRDVYFDGVGPQREFEVTVDKGTTLAIEVTWDGNDDTSAPAVPKDTRATTQPLSVELQWTDNNEDDLAGYVVYRADSRDGNFEEIASDLRLNRYIDQDVQSQQPYFYQVSAVDKAGNESAKTASFSATAGSLPAGVFHFKPSDDTYANQNAAEVAHGDEPTLRYKNQSNRARQPYLKFTIEGIDQDIASATLRLTNATQATDVSLYRVNNTEWTEDNLTWANKPEATDLIQTIQAPSDNAVLEFDLSQVITANGSYAFTLLTTDTRSTARSIQSKESSEGGPLLIVETATAAEPPLAPTNLTANAEANGSISLSWDDNPNTAIHTYSVFRALSQSGSYTELATNLLTREYTDTNTAADVEYFYVVRAIDTAGLKSEDSVTISATASSSTPEPTPTSPPVEPSPPSSDAPSNNASSSGGGALTLWHIGLLLLLLAYRRWPAFK